MATAIPATRPPARRERRCSTAQAATHLGLSRARVLQLLRAGALRGWQIRGSSRTGRVWRVALADVERLRADRSEGWHRHWGTVEARAGAGVTATDVASGTLRLVLPPRDWRGQEPVEAAAMVSATAAPACGQASWCSI